MNRSRHVGIALSGGGHPATAFYLGALLAVGVASNGFDSGQVTRAAAPAAGDEPDPALSARVDAAVAFLDAHGYAEEFWAGIVKRTSGSRMTLAALGPQRTAELLEHGCVLTMALLHVLDGTCPLEPIDRQRFARLCA